MSVPMDYFFTKKEQATKLFCFLAKRFVENGKKVYICSTKEKENKVQDKTLTLYELNTLVREVIESEMAREYWVEAELSEARESRGHCYMELVQKEAQGNTPIAKASAKCWRSQWMLIGPHFRRVTGQELHAGMKVRLKVYAQFHEAFGFAWIVTDIDPTYTLGDLARRRQEIVRQLKEEGVFDLQKELQLPLFCLNIAVVSSASAAGYGDFCHQLDDSGFAFRTRLFPAVMQGEEVEQSIIAALNAIYDGDFDCVVIIRGGGGTADMSGFDTLALAENVAQFPLPIITGIGHDRDECVLDMVSHTRVKTPTAAAAFLIDHAQMAMDAIDDCEERLTRTAQTILQMQQQRLSLLAVRLPALFTQVRLRHEARLDRAEQRMQSACQLLKEQHTTLLDRLHQQLIHHTERRLTDARHQLDLLEQRAASLDPQLLLRRGYSITLHNGRAVRNASQLKAGDRLETRFAEGSVQSEVV